MPSSIQTLKPLIPPVIRKKWTINTMSARWEKYVQKHFYRLKFNDSEYIVLTVSAIGHASMCENILIHNNCMYYCVATMQWSFSFKTDVCVDWILISLSLNVSHLCFQFRMDSYVMLETFASSKVRHTSIDVDVEMLFRLLFKAFQNVK